MLFWQISYLCSIAAGVLLSVDAAVGVVPVLEVGAGLARGAVGAPQVVAAALQALADGEGPVGGAGYDLCKRKGGNS